MDGIDGGAPPSVPQSIPDSQPVSQGNSPASGPQESLQDHSLVEQGSRGTEVSGLQDRLKTAGYQVGDAGKYDAKTEAAVRQYQKDNGLKVDGKVGPDWASMEDIK